MEMQAAMQTAARLCAAARTAPKAHGKDTLHTYVLTAGEKETLACKMEEMGDEMPTWYGRDAAGVLKAQAVVLIGAADMVDCRIMYSIGKTAAEMNFAPDALWLGIPVSISGKNIFFDRGIFHK